LLFIAALIVNSGFLRRGATAVEVAGVKFSPAEYNYFYSSTISEYSNSSSNLPDNSKSLSSQINYETGQTWADFFEERALNDMRLIGSVYAEAEAKGFEMTDEQKSEAEEYKKSEREQIETYYAQNGGFKGFLKLQYGSAMTEKVYDKLADMRYKVSAYYESVYDGFEYADEALAEYYAENKDALDTFVYRSFTVNVETPEAAPEYVVNENGEEIEVPAPELTEEELAAQRQTAYNAARDRANAFVSSITDESSFIEAAREYDAAIYSEDDSTLRRSLGENLEYSLSVAAADWLKKEAKAEAVKSIPVSEDEETNTGFYVIYLSERSENDYLTVNFRNLMVTPKTVDSAEFTNEEGVLDEEGYNAALEAAKTAAKTKADELYAKFTEGGATAEKLAELTDDVFNEVTGGEYENIQREAGFADEIEEWLYADGRRAGEHTLLQTGEDWYIIYFADNGMRYNDYLADTRLRNDDFTAWQESFDTNAVKTSWAMKLK
ncbi:MAG: hypothetical protein LBL25_00075, partial [Oscillospiraceae bacterium]|jgi:hypothetical protein|nr:hypothetical protein [Oscillospiraceae bacterium]